MLQAAQEAQVEDLELVVQLHADDAVVSVDAQQDPGGLAVFAQDHLHLQEQHRTHSAGGSMEPQQTEEVFGRKQCRNYKSKRLLFGGGVKK